jgi:hypothetical protein
VLIVEEAAAGTLLRHLKREGAFLLDAAQAATLAGTLFPGGRFDIRFVGKDAAWIAAEAGIRVPGTTRVLLAPFDLAVPEQPLAHEKLCPVLGLVRVPTAQRGIDAARAVLRIGGRGHSAAIHSSDPRTIMEFGASVEVLRVSVNTGNSLGSAGIQTNLPPSMTVGTGFFGGSSVAENLRPGHFVQWTRLAYNSDPAEPFGNFSGLIPWESPAGPVPPYPYASNMRETQRPGVTAGPAPPPGPGAGPSGPGGPDMTALREEIRRLVVEELSSLIGGQRG